jgi:hypothetical protein
MSLGAPLFQRSHGERQHHRSAPQCARPWPRHLRPRPCEGLSGCEQPADDHPSARMRHGRCAARIASRAPNCASACCASACSTSAHLLMRTAIAACAGFERFAQGQLITLFSATNYCGTANNAGAILVLGRDLVVYPKLIHPLPPQAALDDSPVLDRGAWPRVSRAHACQSVWLSRLRYAQIRLALHHRRASAPHPRKRGCRPSTATARRHPRAVAWVPGARRAV